MAKVKTKASSNGSNGAGTPQAKRDLAAIMRAHGVIERARISIGNQSKAPHLDDKFREYYRELTEALKALEERCEKMAYQEVKQHPTWEWLSKIRGIAPQTAALLLGYLLPPRADKGPSSWYKAAGLVPEQRPDGLSRLPTYRSLPKGERAWWHPRLRRNLYVVGQCLLRGGGHYYQRYLEFRRAIERKGREDPKAWPGGRIHAVAFWKMVKLFLAHLWEVWCRAEGIPCRQPYPIAILGHDGLRPVPWDGDKHLPRVKASSRAVRA